MNQVALETRSSYGAIVNTHRSLKTSVNVTWKQEAAYTGLYVLFFRAVYGDGTRETDGCGNSCNLSFVVMLVFVRFLEG